MKTAAVDRRVLGTAAIVLLAAVLLLGACAPVPAPPVDEEAVPRDWAPEKTSQEGELYRAAGVNIVVLRGDYYEMGRQYGDLLAQELGDFYTAAWGSFTEEQKTQAQGFVHEVSTGYGARQRDVLRGMADGSGLTLTQVLVLDQNISTSFLNFGCSFVAAWGDYTTDGALVIGRNFDWFKDLNDLFSPYLTVTVYNPQSGGRAAATVNYAGMVNGLTGMNDAGLFIEMNNGTNSMGNQFFVKNRTSYLNDMLGFLWDAGSMEAMGKFVETVRPMSPVIINVADGDGAVSYENAPLEVRTRGPNSPGLLVATNHYMLPGWGVLNRPSATHSLERYHNLLKLAEAEKGGIDAAVMKRVLDTPLSAGGATELRSDSDPGNPDVTLYQVVVVPAEGKIWVRTPNYPDCPNDRWVLVDLGRLFAEEGGPGA